MKLSFYHIGLLQERKDTLKLDLNNFIFVLLAHIEKNDINYLSYKEFNAIWKEE